MANATHGLDDGNAPQTAGVPLKKPMRINSTKEGEKRAILSWGVAVVGNTTSASSNE
jgi:hypothetical protein